MANVKCEHECIKCGEKLESVIKSRAQVGEYTRRCPKCRGWMKLTKKHKKLGREFNR